ncbi:MAG: MFS transporter, partial [Pseudomonadales bacterium]|nr:MFS transporter [Pseudomonadales bacterium]
MENFPLRYARRTLLASLVISSMGMTVLFPVLAPLGRQIGLSEFQITSIIAASSLTVFLITPVWGRMSDAWGRKRVMLIGLIGFAAGTSLFCSVLYAGMVGLLTGTLLYASLIVSRVMHATVFSATMPASNAYMADITDVGTRTKGMAASGAASNIGSILGPTLTGLAAISMLMPLW